MTTSDLFDEHPDAASCETLRLNKPQHGGEVIEGDVTELTGQELRERAGIRTDELLLVVGGPGHPGVPVRAPLPPEVAPDGSP